jgi:hypothetical protein
MAALVKITQADVVIRLKENFGEGMLLRIRNSVPNELVVYTIKKNGTDRCHVGFAQRQSQMGQS